jgi:AcrR family transcriptional regulator
LRIGSGIVLEVADRLTASSGQPLGERGLRTRRRILDAVAVAIERDGLRGMRLADVATQVGISVPAFYKYFNDLDEAILALCEEIGRSLPVFSVHDESFGADETSSEGARTFVVRFLEYWDEHRAVLYSRNAAIVSGDARIKAVRDHSYRPLTDGVRDKIQAAQRNGRVDPSIDAWRLATVLSAMLDRVAMIAPQMMEAAGEDDSSNIVDALAYVLDRVLGTEPARLGRSRSTKKTR